MARDGGGRDNNRTMKATGTAPTSAARASAAHSRYCPSGRGGSDQQQHRRGRYRIQRQGCAGACSASAAVTPPTSPTRSYGPPAAPSVACRPMPTRLKSSTFAGWWRQLLHHLPDHASWHHRGRRRQQQHQRVLVGAGQLPERDCRGNTNLGRCACQLLQLRHRHRHLGTGPEHPVHAQHRHHHAGQRQLRVVQRHLDGGAACGRRGCADAIGRAKPA